MKQPLPMLALLAGCVLAGSAGAAITQEQYRIERDKAQASYKTAWDRCQPLNGNARDLCRAEAKGNYEIAKAELEARLKESPRNQDKVRLARAEAAYRIAGEKCDDLRGSAREVCVQDARALLKAAKTEARVGRASLDGTAQLMQPAGDRRETRSEIAATQYAAARERCEALSGDARVHCIGEAKKRFGNRM